MTAPWIPAASPPTPTAQKWNKPFAVVVAGGIDVFTGTAWVRKPVEVWTGTAWVERSIEVYSGTAWVTT